MAVLADSKELEIYTKHFTDLFIYQARQRLDAIRFFFVGYAVLVNAITSDSISEGVRASLLVAGGCVAIVFLRLDYRNAQIVEIDEKPLKDLQRYAQIRAGARSSWQTFRRCDSEKQIFTTYSILVPFLYSVAWLGSFIFFGFSFEKYLTSQQVSYSREFAWLVAIILIVIGTAATVFRPRVLPAQSFQSGDSEIAELNFDLKTS